MNENIEKTLETDAGSIGLHDGFNDMDSNDVITSLEYEYRPELTGTDETSISDMAADMELFFDTPYCSVSSGDILSLQTETEIPATYDYTETLQSIDSKLSLIIFLILSFWVIKHIRISVRNFTGRGIDE